METVPYNMKMRKPKGKVALSLNTSRALSLPGRSIVFPSKNESIMRTSELEKKSPQPAYKIGRHY
jgi:hypothetical protein